MVDVIPAAETDDIPSTVLGETWDLPFQDEDMQMVGRVAPPRTIKLE